MIVRANLLIDNTICKESWNTLTREMNVLYIL